MEYGTALHFTRQKDSLPLPNGGRVYLRQFKINPGLAFVSSSLPCVIMLSAWVSLKVRFPQEPVSKRSQRRMLRERAEKQRQRFSSSPPSPACSNNQFAFPSPSTAQRLTGTRGVCSLFQNLELALLRCSQPAGMPRWLCPLHPALQLTA